MADYSRQIATAQRLIAAKGRPVGFFSRATQPANPLRPLDGPAAPVVEVEGVPAVFVSPGAALGFGVRNADLFGACSQIAIIAADGEHDFSLYKMMEDFDGSEWKVNHTEKLQPAEEPILYFIGVSRP